MDGQHKRRRNWVRYWRIVNPAGRLLAGWLPFWVLVETTGRRSGLSRRTPLAAGPRTEEEIWLIAVHGLHSSWVRNLQAEPKLKLRHNGRWREGTATIRPIDETILARFNRYARTGPRLAGLDPVLVHVAFE